MNVYFDESTQGFCAAFCNLGQVMAQGWDTDEKVGCTSAACVCGSEGRLRLVTAKEAEGFWNDMRSMADAAMAESRW
jgi:hypothetical protein